MKTKRKTKAQKDAAKFLELYGIVHFLMTEKRCPVMHEGRLAYVNCPGVSKDAFKRAVANRAMKNLLAIIDRHDKDLDEQYDSEAGPGTGRPSLALLDGHNQPAPTNEK